MNYEYFVRATADRINENRNHIKRFEIIFKIRK